MTKWIELEDTLRLVLKKGRFEHTLGVRYTAAALAMRYDCGIEQAQLAGILHDCAKGYSGEELLKMAKKVGITVSLSEEKAPHLLHAKVGAYLAEHTYGVKDKEVLDAIRFHTTGKANMSLLEKIIFVSDYIEPNRKMLDGLPKCRCLAFEDMDLAVYEILKNTLEYLQSKSHDEEIDPTTQEAFLYYQEKCLSEHKSGM